MGIILHDKLQLSNKHISVPSTTTPDLKKKQTHVDPRMTNSAQATGLFFSAKEIPRMIGPERSDPLTPPSSPGL